MTFERGTCWAVGWVVGCSLMLVAIGADARPAQAGERSRFVVQVAGSQRMPVAASTTQRVPAGLLAVASPATTASRSLAAAVRLPSRLPNLSRTRLVSTPVKTRLRPIYFLQDQMGFDELGRR